MRRAAQSREKYTDDVPPNASTALLNRLAVDWRSDVRVSTQATAGTRRAADTDDADERATSCRPVRGAYVKLSDLFSNLGRASRGPVARATTSTTPQHSNPYHAVAIVHEGQCCAAALTASRTRFLSRSAPTLPLPDCTLGARCTCHFQKFHDRRQGDRRLFGNARDVRWFNGQERRRASGRRKSDH